MRSAEDKKFTKAIKALNKECFKRNIRWDPHPYINKDWKKEWGPFIKYDADWDGAYLLDLIIYKIEKMKQAQLCFSMIVQEELDEIIQAMDKAIALGRKIQDHDYEQESHEFSKIHCAHVVLIYKKGDVFGKDRKPLHELVYWYDPNKEKEEDSVDGLMEGYFRKNAVKEWAEANGYDPKDLTEAYSGRWDDEANYKIWLKLIKKESKALQKDYDDFFKIIARNIQKWWY